MSESPYRAPGPACSRCAKASKASDLRQGMCAECDAIRSIRIAATLNEQYGRLLEKKHYGAPEHLELAIGEAQQIYPEIWSHLDTARAALVRNGIAVDAYDRLRTTESGLAVNEVTVNDQSPALLLGGRVNKSVTFNGQGHHNAIEADRVLRTALPHVDWIGLDRADAAEIEAAGSIRPAAWKRALVTGIALAIGAVLVVVYIYARISQ